MCLPLSSAFSGELPTSLHLYPSAPGTPSTSRLGSPPRTFLSSVPPEEMHVLLLTPPSLSDIGRFLSLTPHPSLLVSCQRPQQLQPPSPPRPFCLPWVHGVHHQGACDTWPVLGWVSMFMNSFCLGCLSCVGHCSRPWRLSCGQNRCAVCLPRAHDRAHWVSAGW